MGSRAHCHSGPEFLTRAAKLSHDSNKREALERHDRKEGKVANMEANLSWLLHTHSCSERQNMENPGWKRGTSTVCTVPVRLNLTTTAVSPEAPCKSSCHPAQPTRPGFLVIPYASLSYSRISRSSELFFSHYYSLTLAHNLSFTSLPSARPLIHQLPEPRPANSQT